MATTISEPVMDHRPATMSKEVESGVTTNSSIDVDHPDGAEIRRQVSPLSIVVECT